MKVFLKTRGRYQNHAISKNDTNINAAVVVIFKPLSFAVVFSTCEVTLAVFLAITIAFAKNKMNMVGKKMMEMAMMMTSFTKTRGDDVDDDVHLR